MSTVKIFDRTSPEVIANAIKQTLPYFKVLYADYSTPFILEEAYHSIRSKFTEPVNLPLSRGEFNHLKETFYRLKRPSKLVESMVDDSLETPPEFKEFIKEKDFEKDLVITTLGTIPTYKVKDYTEKQKVTVEPSEISKPKEVTLKNREQVSEELQVSKNSEVKEPILTTPIKVKKGVEIKGCFERGLNIEECLKHLEKLGAPTTKLWVEYSYQQLKEKT